MPRRSLLVLLLAKSRCRVNAWVKIGCKSLGQMGQFWVQINTEDLGRIGCTARLEVDAGDVTVECTYSAPVV